MERRRTKKASKSLASFKKESQRSASAKRKCLARLRIEYVSSAKIDKTMALLESIRLETLNEKVLIFSLWTSFLDLLDVPIADGAVRYVRYDGSIEPRDRDAAVKEFIENPRVNIFLISLTAGNMGLNLTAASHVIFLEPFWNPFVEDQAVDRAHRIGQKRDVTVHRVFVANTVEDRILELQEGKGKLVDAALSEEGAQGVSRLGISKLELSESFAGDVGITTLSAGDSRGITPWSEIRS